MGSKGNTTTTSQQQQQSYAPNPLIAGAGTQALQMAQAAASQPFQMPAAPVAGFTPFQQQAFGQVQGAQGMAQPYFNQGQNYLQQSAAPITASDVNQYYNPMAGSVTAQLQNIFGQQNQQNTGSLTQAAGGVGADRIAVGQSVLANQQGLAAGQTYAGLYQQALQAAQQQKQMSAGAGYGISQLGPAALNASLQGTGALAGAGSQQQQLQQAQLNSPYQQQLAQIAYPFQTAQYLAGITGGLAPAFGGTTTGSATGTTTTPTPSALSQILGVGTAGAGLVGAFGGFGGGGGKGGGAATANTGAPGGGYYGPSGDVQAGPGYYPAARGGKIIDLDKSEYADGGEIDGLTPIPNVPFTQGGGGQFHNNLQFAQPSAPQKQGGGGGGGGGLGDIAKMAVQLAPLIMMRRGGSAESAGGAVNPFDFGQHFDDGGGVYDEAPAFADRPQFSNGHLPFSDIASAAGNYYGKFLDNPVGNYVKEKWDSTAGVPPVVTPAAAGEAPPASPIPFTGGSNPAGAALNPYAPPVPAPTPPVAAQPSAPAPSAGAASPYRGGTGSGVNAYMMPQAQQPYPDALKRDWGQNLARSPWLALVAAGAKMAQTAGPIGSAIGAGLGAGAGTLTEQRKELRSEEDINQKAQHLYQQAQEHLDKYNKMTPVEAAHLKIEEARLAQGKFQPTNYIGADGQYHVGIFDARRGQILDPGSHAPVEAGRLTGRNAGIETQNSIASQARVAAQADPSWVADPLGTLNRYRVRSGLPPLGAAQGTQAPGEAQPKVGDRKQFKQGVGVWDGQKWAPEGQ